MIPGTSIGSSARVRSAAFGVVATMASVLGHASAGGRVDIGAALGLVALFALVHRALPARREQGWAALTGWLLAAQGLAHVLLSASTGPVVDPRTTVCGHLLDAPSDGHLMGVPLMLGAHVGVAVLLGWVLRQGEALAWAAARRVASPVADRVARVLTRWRALAAALRRPVVALTPDPTRGRPRRDEDPGRVRPPREAMLLCGGIRRGPPATALRFG